MRTPSISLVRAAAVLTAFSSSLALAQGAQEEAIKRVIRTETESFYGRQADVWESTWLHDSSVTRTLVSSGGYSSEKGWDHVGPPVTQEIKQNPAPIPIQLQTDNYSIRVDGALAWVEYDQRITVPGDSVPYVSREHRALVKQGGQWKIVSQITNDVGSFGTTPAAFESTLNATGYRLLGAKRVDDAIEVLKLNARLFPSSWNVYDSLGEAYATAGQTQPAIQNYEKSVAMNPKNESGKAALAKLRGNKTP